MQFLAATLASMILGGSAMSQPLIDFSGPDSAGNWDAPKVVGSIEARSEVDIHYDLERMSLVGVDSGSYRGGCTRPVTGFAYFYQESPIEEQGTAKPADSVENL